MSMEALLTGFFSTGAEITGRRREQADNYFNSQYERARTRGVESLTQRRQRRDEMEGLALNLRQNANMPEEIVRALINEGPEALQAAMRIYQAHAGDEESLTEEWWRDTVYPTVRDMAVDTGRPLGEFLDQVAGLYPTNLQASREEGRGGDPFSALITSALGINAMDRARNRLDTTTVAEGLTASQLLAMEGRPRHERQFNTTGLGPNLQNIARQAAERGTPLTTAQVRSFTTQFNRAVDELATSIRQDYIAREEEPPSREELRRMAIPRIAEQFALESGLTDRQLQQLPVIWNAIRPPEEEEEGSPRNRVDESAAVAEETEASGFPRTIMDGDTTLTFLEITPQGAIYLTPDGRRTPPIPRNRLPGASQNTAANSSSDPVEIDFSTPTDPNFRGLRERMGGVVREGESRPSEPLQPPSLIRALFPERASRENMDIPEVITFGGRRLTLKLHTSEEFDPNQDSYAYIDDMTGEEIMVPATALRQR